MMIDDGVRPLIRAREFIHEWVRSYDEDAICFTSCVSTGWDT